MLRIINKDRIFNICSVLCMFTFFFLMLLLSCLKAPLAKGEGDDYALETVAIQMTGNIEITEAVIEQAKKDFPEFAYRFEESWIGANAGTTDLYQAYNGKIYPWYGAAYSCVCIIMKLILSMLHLNQTYTFALTNVCLYTFALAYVFYVLRTTRKNILLLILLLICSPSVVYYSWPSAEIFIFTFITLSLVNFYNKSYKRAAFYISVAGSMNTTCMVLGIIIIVDYFWELVKGTTNFRDAIARIMKNIKHIIVFGICFIPALSTYAYNLIFLHTLELQTGLGLARTDYWFGRFLAYLFDLNMGYIAYYFVSFTLWLILTIYGAVKRNRMTIMLSIAFLGIVWIYSLHFHINCGMEGIARYSAWAAPIFLFTVATQYENIFSSQRIKKLFQSAILMASISTMLILIWFYKYNQLSHLQYSPLASMVLDNSPQFYNPFPYTFIARTQHIDGGYWGNEDQESFYYEDSEGYVRKVLVSEDTKAYLMEHLAGTEEDIGIVKKRLMNAEHFEYVDIEKGIQVFVDKDYPCVFYPAEDATLASKSWGIYEREEDKHWFSNDVTIVLRGEEINEQGIEIEYYVMQEMIDKYAGDILTGDVFCNGDLIGTIDLNKAGHNILTIKSDMLPECTTGFYRIGIKGDYYLQPSVDIVGGTDIRKLFILVPYIGVPR